MSNLKDKFKKFIQGPPKEEDEEDPVPLSWIDNTIQELNVTTKPEEKLKMSDFGPPPPKESRWKKIIPKWTPIQVPISMKIRRIIAFFMMMAFIISSYGSVISQYWAGLTVSVPTALLLFDYLNQTRAKKEQWRTDWFKLENAEKLDLDENK